MAWGHWKREGEQDRKPSARKGGPNPSAIVMRPVFHLLRAAKRDDGEINFIALDTH